MRAVLLSLWKEDEGQTIFEYAILVALLVLAGITAMKGLTTALNSSLSSAGSNLTSLR